MLLFSVFCVLVVGSFFYGEEVFNHFNKGVSYNQVIDGKPTVLVVFEDEKLETSAYLETSKMIGYIGNTYAGKVSIQTISAHSEEADIIKEKFNIPLARLPLIIILSKQGHVVAVYKGEVPFEKINFDLQQLTN